MENTILEFTHVTGRNRKFHLKDINFSLDAGYIYAITGENGAGKTTLMKYILNDNSKYSGDIRLCGQNIFKKHTFAMQNIGFISDDNMFFEHLSTSENANILSTLYEGFDLDLFRNVLSRCNVSSATIYQSLSRGEKIKFQLAFAIAHHSKLYLLDEATAGMDPAFRLEFFDILRELLCAEDCCVLMTSHNTSEIFKQTDYMAIMHEGTLTPFKESLEGF